MKESTVRKFKKIFGPPTAHHHRSQVPSLPPPSPPPTLPPPPIPPPPPLPILQQHQASESNYYHHQPYGYATYGTHQPTSIHNNYHSHHQNLYVMAQPLQPVPPYPTYSSLPPPPQYQPSVQLPAYSRNWNEECAEVSNPIVQPPDNPSPPTCPTIARPPSPVVVPLPPPPPPPPPPLELNPATRIPIRQEKTIGKKKTNKKVGRGSYATYSPQFRLEIGRFAVEYGCQEAAQYFKVEFG